jgi:predicted amidohydrolase
MKDLRVTVIQTKLFWEDKEKNLDHFRKLVSGIREKTDLILLPETFNTGFSIHPERIGQIAEAMEGPSMDFLKQLSRETSAAVCSTLFIREDAQFSNRFVFYYPDGRYATYDKRHLFRLSEEGRIFRKGTSKAAISYHGWNLSPMICYDLRFPVWNKNILTDRGYAYDILIFVANWPAVRSQAWKILIPARAIENMAYTIGVNRIGKDGNGKEHTGDSIVADPQGNVLFQAPEGTETVQTITLSYTDMVKFRDSMGFAKDWDQFTIREE